MDPEDIILSEITQQKRTNTVWFHLHVESNIKKKLMEEDIWFVVTIKQKRGLWGGGIGGWWWKVQTSKYK